MQAKRFARALNLGVARSSCKRIWVSNAEWRASRGSLHVSDAESSKVAILACLPGTSAAEFCCFSLRHMKTTGDFRKLYTDERFRVMFFL